MYTLKKEQYSKRFRYARDKWNLLESSGILDDDAILETLFHFATKCNLENPFYKFIEVLHQVEDRDKVLIEDLETLDEYYKMGLITRLLTHAGISEYYTGAAFRDKKLLARHLKGKYSRFDYIKFHNFLSGLY